jgi:hypothetical protein
VTITSAPPQDPLDEGVQFAAAHHTEVALQMSTLWVAVSLSIQSILPCLPIDVS